MSSALPRPGMRIDPANTALVITDPQNDFLSEKGAAWSVVSKSVQKNQTIENLVTLLKLAKNNGIQVFISPHYYYPPDQDWKFGGVMEVWMHSVQMFARKSPLNLEGFENSGADWLPPFKPYINDGKTVVCSPHKAYGPQNNDLVLQLRKHGIDRVMLAGMSANLCVESHMRDLLERGFEVTIVSDATAAAQVPEHDGYAAALVNFRYITNDVLTTEEVEQTVSHLQAA